jgi:hypothetical protein
MHKESLSNIPWVLSIILICSNSCLLLHRAHPGGRERCERSCSCRRACANKTVATWATKSGAELALTKSDKKRCSTLLSPFLFLMLIVFSHAGPPDAYNLFFFGSFEYLNDNL